jgi:pimeloyl-ACP methyl ester carboxylesterase
MKKRAVLLFVFSCLAAIIYAQQSKVEFGNNDKAGKYADIRGFKMYYEIYGKGQPLLIIHGNGGSINNFQHQIPYFSKSYKVILADSRAHGKSRDDADSLSYEMMADDLSALLDYLKLDSCYVIGWSDGGNNGLLLAIRHPEKVKKLAITGANLWPDSTAVDPFAYHWAMSLNDSIKKVPVTPESRNARKILHLLSYEPHISTAQLKLIKSPALVIGGDNDVILPAHTLLIAASIPFAYLWILPNSGHSTPIFYKDEFNQKVDEFFRAPYRKIEGMGKLD